MRHADHRRTDPGGVFPKLFHDPFRVGRIQAGGRFIGQNQPGAGEQRAAECDPLLFAPARAV